MASQKQEILKSVPDKSKNRSLFRAGFVSGLGWAFGVTIGFVAVSTILIIVLRSAGGLPVVGGVIADIVSATQEQLLKRSVFNTIEAVQQISP